MMQGDQNRNEDRRDEQLYHHYDDTDDDIQNEDEDCDESMAHDGSGVDVYEGEEIFEDNNDDDDDDDDDTLEEDKENYGHCDSDENEERNKDNDDQNGEGENEDNIADNELRLAVRALWKTGLEIFIHQLLYRRRVYPTDTFSSARFVGAECKINRNPSVLIYISEALKVILPTIFGDDNVGNVVNESRNHDHDRCRPRELLVEIYDRTKGITYEHFSLSFLSMNLADDDIDITSAALSSSFSLPLSVDDRRSSLANSIVREVEKDLRDLVCSTGKLEGLRPFAWDDSVSFKILLLINPTMGDNNSNDNIKSIAALDSALDDTKWFRTTRTPTVPDSRTKNRVLCNLANSACQFQCRLMSSQIETT